MKTKFLSKLNELAVGTGLAFTAIELRDSGNKLDINAFLCSNVDTKEKKCHVTFYFRMTGDVANVSMQLHNPTLHDQTPNLNQHFEYLAEAVKVSQMVLVSKTILSEFENYSNTAEEERSNKLAEKIAKLSETHTLLDTESAKAMLDSYITLIREQQQKALEKGLYGNVSESHRLVVVNDDCNEIVHFVRVSIDKRLSFKINDESVSKSALLAFMNSKWAQKL